MEIYFAIGCGPESIDSQFCIMRALLLFAVFSTGAFAARLPRRAEGEGAEVIRVVDDKTPILLSAGLLESDNAVVPVEVRVGNGSAVAEGVSAGPVAPTPVPEDVAITTEKFVQSTPNLVPSVVDISTAGPTPPAFANPNATTTRAPEEDDEDDSEEDGASEEEDDEEDEEEDDDEEEDEADDEDEEDDADDAAAKAKKEVIKKVVKREVAAAEEVSQSFKESSKVAANAVVVSDGDEDQQSDEEEKVEAKDKVTSEKVVLKPTGLQAVHASEGLGEDDEAESVLQVPAKPASVVIAN